MCILDQGLFQGCQRIFLQVVAAVACCVLRHHLRAHVLGAALGPVQRILELPTDVLLKVCIILSQLHQRHQYFARFYVKLLRVLEHELVELHISLLNKLCRTLELLVHVLDLLLYSFEL